MNFSDLLSRSDIHDFQVFLGNNCISLLSLFDSKMSSPTFLRDLVKKTLGPEGILLDKQKRTVILSLLRPREASELAHALGGKPSQDPFEFLKTTRFSVGSENERILFSFFKLNLPLRHLTPPAAGEEDTVPEYQLFPYQRRASSDAQNILLNSPFRALLHMPTGSGKTRTAMDIICSRLRQFEPSVCLWLASSEELCDQAFDEFKKAWRFLGNRKLPAYRFWGGHNPDLKKVKDGLIVASFQKVFRFSNNDLKKLVTLGSLISFIILDEAHQAIAPQYKQAIDTLLVQRKETSLLGLSATPGRTWNDITADERLAVFFARRKVSLYTPDFQNPVTFLVSKGYLAKAVFEPLLYKSGFVLNKTDLARIKDSLDIPTDILERIGEDQIRNIAIVQRAEELLLKHKRIILFASSVSHAHLISNVLVAKGHASAAVTTKTNSDMRAHIISDFKGESEKSMVLCNYGVLTTGFDAPRTSCVIIARPTKSLVLYSQMVGRAIRGPQAGGNQKALIVTVNDPTLPGFGNVEAAFVNWEDVWTFKKS